MGKKNHVTHWAVPVVMATAAVVGLAILAGQGHTRIRQDVDFNAKAINDVGNRVLDIKDELKNVERRQTATETEYHQKISVLQSKVQRAQADELVSKAQKAVAAHDLDAGAAILTDEQSKDELNDRPRTAKALGLIKEAQKALKP